MLWPIIALLALFAALALHLWWRNRFQQAQLKAQTELYAVRRAYEQSASQIQTQQETLFNSMTEGLLVLDQGGRIQIANRAFTSLFGVTADVRSRTIMEALRLHELADLVESFETRKKVLGYELKLARPHERRLQVNGAAIFDAGGQRPGTILVFHELTRLKQLERTRQEFVANVSHELRTPLSLIKGYVETLLNGAQDNPDVAAKLLHTID